MVSRVVLASCAVLAAACGRSGEQKTSQAAPPKDAAAPADAPAVDAGPRPLDLAKATLVIARGDIQAVAPEGLRPLTATGGAVVAALRAGKDRIAVVSRGARGLAVSTLDLGSGEATTPIELGAGAPITVAYSTKAPEGFWIGAGAPRIAWQRLAADALAKLPKSTKTPSGPRLVITAPEGAPAGATPIARLVAPPSALVTADWDEHGLASAIKLKTTNRVVAPPSPGLVAGGSLAWSPGRASIAFVAQLDDTCTPGAPTVAAYVADAATGHLTEVARATRGLAVAWAAERVLVIAGDRGVVRVDLAGDDAQPIEGATELLVPRTRPACADLPPAATEITPSSRVDGTPDAAVVEPPPPVSSSPQETP